MTPSRAPFSIRGYQLLAWAIAVLSVLLVLSGAWMAQINNRAGLPPAVRQTVQFYLDELPGALWAVVGALILHYKPRHASGWLMCAVGLLWSAKLFAGEYAIRSYFLLPAPAPFAALASWLVSWGWFGGFVPMCALLFTLPSGRVPSRRWRIPLWIAMAVLGGFVLAMALRIWPVRGREMLTMTDAGIGALMGPLLEALFPVALFALSLQSAMRELFAVNKFTDQR